jgi:hypothetical protein
MKIVWERDKNRADFNAEVLKITCDVRNELNGRRRLHDPKEVRRVVQPDGHWGPPYMPRPFPLGTWRVIAVEDTADKEFAPVKIRTNAHQLVRTWALDAAGGYDHEEDRLVEDAGYHLHFAEFSRTTLGCGRLETAGQARSLAAAIRKAMGKGEIVQLEVL